tara:strand:+ start:515 stop:661 length:147 start_codon:yes stop_codon:yes gene_type:complete
MEVEFNNIVTHHLKILLKEKSPFPIVWKKASHWKMLQKQHLNHVAPTS